MHRKPEKISFLRCACNQVEAQAEGEPILSLACHCKDCRDGAAKVEALSSTAPILHDENGGVAFTLYRRDRFRFTQGEELLKSIQVEPDSPNRVYASCCNSGFILDLPKFLHWIPVHRGRLENPRPATELRINLGSQIIEGSSLPTDVPSFKSFAPKFMYRLLKAKLQMLLGL